MRLKDKTIIITGASSGIGAAAARLFARHGAQVVLGARRGDILEQTVAEIAASGGHAAYVAGDVGDPDVAQSLLEKAVTTFGGLDGAFNNAGMVGPMGPVTEMTDQTWAEVIQTNLTSAFLSARAQIPAIVAQGGGSLVFTGSFVGVANGGMPGMAAYAASKAGLMGLVQSLAMDWAGDGVRVNAVLPGGTKTAMAGDDPAAHDFVANLHPVKRLATPDEIAQAALFLLSDEASFVTGAPLAVDGGMSVRML
ncbi:SDR family oxidoreductase [uncultured Tateyamaria sp.]|uniref:SDR family oxidoreductase n=1 Tax=uncultured Tateyamaria sp. TaxID=455651 RepID=UPI00262DE940|nr:SDR family oxidoreductase [uncultured Tateyamaria sp.]